MDMFLMLISSVCLLGIIALTVMIEIENLKRNKSAKEKPWKGWSLTEPK